MKKSVKALIIICAAIMFLTTLAGAALAAFSFKNTHEIKEAFNKLSAEEEDPAREDDVCIGGEYMIRSTTDISDAYISGDSSSLDDRRKETLKMASDIIGEIIEDGMTPFEKERAVYLWLTTKLKPDAGILTVIPTSQEDCDDPYGVLKNRSAVCVGYATTFRLFMQMLGIECKVVHDTSLSHSWDLIKLDDEWYHTDCYFDSDEGTYTHFNLSDEIMCSDHEWNRNYFPKASGLKYNYAMMQAEELEDIFEIPAFAKEHIEDPGCFSCRIKGGIAPDMEPAARYMTETLSEAVNNTKEGIFNYYWAKDAEGDYVLCMFYSDNSGTDISDGIPEEMLEKINDAITESFDYSFEFDSDKVWSIR